uniref:Geranyl diphosphate synthase n=1 Tax=Tetraselmis sp. GSL018 TaxID=582737 RepID=A0A061R6Y9_9CHLO|mmetsp:Transcript_15809/g.37523  ORF Transcript_15809/g.37523 Transcript_15809/m.37523 type:complete len:449 (-) Transcript_15809:93-1439(-)|eukprot:CAMPEP_0177600428 /NCGR_PEP_ID=MMETSP0419_2-20121207/13620_1 /TAXON_ID=582737 /ORGANISM="Tetraselmis sp., Strain GSL018" /LENGTH=448 /DNA_ID=CAMNT_0019093425 /DNA_START=116 /DNA_END=1462 /DNA_ORIENTATION=+
MLAKFSSNGEICAAGLLVAGRSKFYPFLRGITSLSWFRTPWTKGFSDPVEQDPPNCNHEEDRQSFRTTSTLGKFSTSKFSSLFPQVQQPPWEGSAGPSPFVAVGDEIDCISERLRQSIVSDIPDLAAAANYYFKQGREGKRMRPTMLMLMASSLSETSRCPDECLTVDRSPPAAFPPDVRRRQQRIAEIAEMIHVASLLHDDVIDTAATRRGLKSLNATMGNKLAILAGDYLLARASVTLASLNAMEPVALMSQVIEHLVSGEIIQLRMASGGSGEFDHEEARKLYNLKTFYKTASLPANAARSIAVLAGCPAEVCDLAQNYGRHFGMAFQITDDVLDFTANATMLGKPALNDLKSGLTTAPVLFAAEEFPELIPLIERSYKQPGDIEKAVKLVKNSRGIDQSLSAAREESQLACEAIDALPATASEYTAACREALKSLARNVLTRTK